MSGGTSARTAADSPGAVPTSASNGTGTPPSPLPGASTSGDTAPSHTSRNRRRPEQRHVRHAGEVALTPEEVLRLLAPVDVLQEWALLEFALTTGIRREDMVGIPLEGVDFDQGTVRFYESKKRRTRTVPMDARVMVTLRSHVRTLAKGERWLFPSPRRAGSHQSGRYAYNVLGKWLKGAGLTPRPFHALRATAYKLAKARGWSVEQAAALLGDTIRVAKEFYGVVTPWELRQVCREKPLLGWGFP